MSRKQTIASALVAAVVYWAGAAPGQTAATPPGGQPSTAAAQAASILLEKGIYNEETVGDLDSAMKIYKQIADDAQAGRPYAAQAQYRLGLCLMKKGQNREGMKTFQTLIAQFPDQKDWLAKAREKTAEARGKISPAEVEKIVEEVVTTISTCAETDPRVGKALEGLQDLDDKAAVTAVAKYLDSDRNTIRQSALYVLWKGPFRNIAPAVPALTKLASHQEEYTRGMAALALGQRKIESALQVLSEMATSDKSGYARRCAVYALGLLGRPEAKPVLEKALKDTDFNVRNNAEAALTMLEKAGRTFALVAEYTLPCIHERVAELLDLDTGRRLTSKEFGENDRQTHQWVRENGLDLGGFFEKGTSGILAMDVAVLPVATELWDTLTPGELLDNKALGQQEPGKITPMVPTDTKEKPTTYLLRTREGGMGILQMVGSTEEPRAVKIRYRLLRAAPQSASSPSEADKRAGENLAGDAWKLWQERKLAEAEGIFQQALAKDPTNANAWNGLGWAQFNQGKTANAKASFEKALALEPKHAGALNGLAWIAKGQGKTEQAIEYWKKAVQALPSATAALSGLAGTYMELKQYDKAVEYYQMWLKAEPDSADAKAGLEKARTATQPSHPSTQAGALQPRNADFDARVAAASAIRSTDDRDDAYRAIALEAAESNQPGIVRRCLGGIHSTDKRDQAASEAAAGLARIGAAKAALEIAGVIRSVDLRDQTLKRVAAGKELPKAQ